MKSDKLRYATRCCKDHKDTQLARRRLARCNCEGNPASPWTRYTNGGRALYVRGEPYEQTLEESAEGVSDEHADDYNARFEETYAMPLSRQELIEPLVAAGIYSAASPWIKFTDGERVLYARTIRPAGHSALVAEQPAEGMRRPKDRSLFRGVYTFQLPPQSFSVQWLDGSLGYFGAAAGEFTETAPATGVGMGMDLALARQSACGALIRSCVYGCAALSLTLWHRRR